MTNLFDFGMTLREPNIWDVLFVEDHELDFSDEIYEYWMPDWEYQLYPLTTEQWDESKPWCESSARRVVMWDNYVLYITGEVKCDCYPPSYFESCGFDQLDLFEVKK